MEMFWLGRAPYREVLELQERLRQRVLSGGPEAVLLCEHEPVLTLGRSAPEAHVLVSDEALAKSGIDRVHTTRGGQVTYHGPGQIVTYPILRLRKGVLQHVCALGEAAVLLAAGLAVSARFSRDPVGVFAGARKLAAIGVHVQRRVTIHGMAVNLTRHASEAFRRSLFLPCGESGRQVTSLAEEQTLAGQKEGEELQAATVAGPLCAALCQAFRLPPVPLVDISTSSLLSHLPSVE